jgi:hypothetical protein
MACDTPSADSGIELLYADLKYCNDSFWKNEEVGEKRVNFFVSLVTAVLTALVALAKLNSDSIDDAVFLLVIIYALFALLVMGVITLARLVKRNEVTDDYKARMDKLRKILKEHGTSPALKDYPDFPVSYKPKFRGLANIVAAINSLILTALTGVLLIALSKSLQFPKYCGLSWVFALTSIGVLVFVLSLTLQPCLLKLCEMWENKQKDSEFKKSQNPKTC